MTSQRLSYDGLGAHDCILTGVNVERRPFLIYRQIKEQVSVYY